MVEDNHFGRVQFLAERLNVLQSCLRTLHDLIFEPELQSSVILIRHKSKKKLRKKYGAKHTFAHLQFTTYYVFYETSAIMAAN